MPASDPDLTVPRGDSPDSPTADSVTPADVPLVPSTDAHFQFNQMNVQQIPQTAFDKLSSEQLAGLLESTLSHLGKVDERQFQFAMDRAEKESKSKRLNTIFGGCIAVTGLLVVPALVYMESDIVAGIVATFLTTMIAVVVGSRLLT